MYSERLVIQWNWSVGDDGRINTEAISASDTWETELKYMCM